MRWIPYSRSGAPVGRLFRLALGVIVCGGLRPLWALPLYEAPSIYPVDGFPVGVRTGAFDADPALDLVTGNQTGENGPSLSLLGNRGDGSFGDEERLELIGTDYILQATAAGDFDADGWADVAVAVDDVSGFPIRSAVRVYLNDGQGGLLSPLLYPLSGFFPRCLEVADVNDDGAEDLVVCHAMVVDENPIGLVSVLVGRKTGGLPDGTFAPASAFTVGTAPSSLAVGRLDADDHSDVLVGSLDDGRAYALFGTGGSPLLGEPVEVARVVSPSAVALGDIDSTPLPDVLVTSYSTHTLLTLSQTASRVFAAPEGQLIALLPQDMALAELSGDDKPDLVVVSALGAELWFGDGDGRFAFGEQIATEVTLDDVTLADLNQDGEADVAASSSSGDLVVVSLHSPPPEPGDANCDGRIDSADLDAVLSRIFLPGCAGADVDGDGRVGAADVVLVMELIVGRAS